MISSREIGSWRANQGSNITSIISMTAANLTIISISVSCMVSGNMGSLQNGGGLLSVAACLRVL